MTPAPIVFLVDVDNTLLDNDRIQDDLKRHLESEFGAASRDRYWAILEALFVELGYRDYLGALQRYRTEHPQDVHLMSMSSYLVDYPFANRLYPGALDVLERLREWGPTVILSDGDVVFQPRKVERSGIWEAVDGHVLIYIHKEEMLDEVARRYPAQHYVLVDDKPRILAAVKAAWGDRVTTILVLRRIAARDLIQHFFLMDEDQHVTVHGLPDAGALDLARLEDDVAVGEDHCRAPLAEPFEDVERPGIEAIGERVVDQVRRHRHEVHVLGVLGPVALQRAEIIPIAELDEQRFEDRPVPITRRGAELTLEMALEVVLNAIVVQQRVVHVDQEDDRSRGHDATAIDAPARDEARVKSRSDWKAGADSISSVQRQRQLPSARPG